MFVHRRYAPLAGLALAAAWLMGCVSPADQRLRQAQERMSVAREDDALTFEAAKPLADAEHALARARTADEPALREHFAYMTERNLEFAAAMVARRRAEERLALLQQSPAIAGTAPPPSAAAPSGAAMPSAHPPPAPPTRDAAAGDAGERPVVAMREAGQITPRSPAANLAREMERERLEMAIRVAREAQARAQRLEKSMDQLRAERTSSPPKSAAPDPEESAVRQAREQDRKRLEVAIREARDARKQAREIEKTMEQLQSRPPPAPGVLAAPDVHFATGATALSPGAKRRLDPLIVQLRDDKTLHVIVEGYTDSSGAHEDRLETSLDRAKAVKAYLVENGIPAHRVQTLGLGDRYPVATNETEEGRRRNSRVEIVIDRAPWRVSPAAGGPGRPADRN